MFGFAPAFSSSFATGLKIEVFIRPEKVKVSGLIETWENSKFSGLRPLSVASLRV